MGMVVRTKQAEFCTLRSSGEYIVDKDNVATSTAEFFVYPKSAVQNHLPIVGKTLHPIWSGLYCKTASVQYKTGGALIKAVYEGADSTGTIGTGDNETTMEVSCTMREEPIETHPQFETWAGTPAKPVGARFDEDGIFKGWNASNSYGKQLMGVKSYLVPSYSGSITYVSRGRPSLSGIGGRGGGGLPSIGGKYQWLNTGISFQTLADGKCRVTETYLLSGPNGWNNLIYK